MGSGPFMSRKPVSTHVINVQVTREAHLTGLLFTYRLYLVALLHPFQKTLTVTEPVAL